MASVGATEIFAKNLRLHRENAGLSQERLGELCNLHRTEISLLERAQRDPRLQTIARLASALEIPASVLLEGIS